MLEKQNKNLIYFFIFIVFSFAVIFFKTGLFQTGPSKENLLLIQSKNTVSQDQMGESANSLNESYKKNEEQNNLNLIFSTMRDCFSFKSNLSAENKGNIESIAQVLQSEFGNFSSEDKWINWKIKMKNGLEQILKLELIKGPSDKSEKILKQFSLNKDGVLSLVAFPADQQKMSTEAIIMDVLKSGEVISKEKAGVLHFAQNLDLNYVERDGLLTQIEVKGDKIAFKCENARANASCACQK